VRHARTIDQLVGRQTSGRLSGGLPIRQNRQLPKARHGAGARPVHCEFFKYLFNVHVFVKQHKLVDLVQYIVLVELKVFFVFIV